MERDSLMTTSQLDQPIAEINGKEIFEFMDVRYSNGRRHVYGIDEKGKKRHLSQNAVLAAYGFEDRSKYVPDVLADDTDNPDRLTYIGNGEAISQSIISTSIVEKKNKPTNNPESKVAPILEPAVAVAATAAVAMSTEGPIAASRRKEGFFNRAKKWLNDKNEQFGDWANTNAGRKAARFAIGGLALLGVGSGLVVHGAQAGYDKGPQIPAVATPGHNGPGAMVMAGLELPKNNSNSVSIEKGGSNITAMEQAINANLLKIGLQPGEYNEVTNPDSPFPGNSIEADQFSMDHGPQAWANNHVAYTINGAKQLSKDILTGTGTFSASDAAVAQQALKYFNAPDSVINQLKNGDYSNMDLRVFTLAPNVMEVTYHDMSWNNNGTFAHEDNRIVNPANQDAIAQLAYTDASGNVHVLNFRIDCGGANVQVFGTLSVEVPKTPAPIKTPSESTTTVPAKPTETTTTTAPHNTTTTAPHNTTTTAPHNTTTTAPHITTTTAPHITTTTAPHNTTTTAPHNTTTTAPHNTTTTIPEKNDPVTSPTTVGAPPEGLTPSIPTTSVKSPNKSPNTTMPTVPEEQTTVPATSVPQSFGGGNND